MKACEKYVFMGALTALLVLGLASMAMAGINRWNSNLDITCTSLAVSPSFANDTTVMAGAAVSFRNGSTIITGANTFKSNDGGATWTELNTSVTFPVVPTCIAFSPDYVNDHTIFVGGGISIAGGNVYRTTDGGLTWIEFRTGVLPDERVLSVAVSPHYATDKIVFIGTASEGVFKTFDGGFSWYPVSSGLTDGMVPSLAISPGYMSDQTIFAGTGSSGVFKSTDGGESWAQVNAALPGVSVAALAISPYYVFDQTLFAGDANGQGVFKTTDGGASWQPARLDITDWHITALAVSPAFADDQTVFAGTQVGGVFISTDGGGNWGTLNNGFTHLGITALAVSSNFALDHTLFAGGGGPAIQSNPGVFSYTIATPVSAITNPLDHALLTSTAFTITGTAVDGAAGAGILKVEVSVDGGETWSLATDTSGAGTWATWSFDWTNVRPGLNFLKSRATDNAGNVENPGRGITVAGVASVTDPVIFTITPDKGVAGDTVTLTGVNLGSARGKVLVGNKGASIIDWKPSGDQIVFTVPSLPAGMYHVSAVTSAGKTSNTVDYQVMGPRITTLSASSGIGGALITINGSFLGPSPTVSLRYLDTGKVVHPIRKAFSNTSVTFKVPKKNRNIDCELWIKNSQGISNSLPFSLLSPSATP